MKTVEEEAYKYDEYKKGVHIFKEGVRFSQRWIPIEEELPVADDHSIDIEMKLENGVVLTGYMFTDGDWMKFTEQGTGKIIKKKVTHWRPLNYEL